MTVTRQSSTEDGTYVAIIRYGAYHDMKSFTLSTQPATLTFNVPLTEITGEKLFYGIHFESGTAIYRNSPLYQRGTGGSGGGLERAVDRDHGAKKIIR